MVISFLVFPIVAVGLFTMTFGWVHGLIVAVTCCIYNALENKYHSRGLVARHWPEFQSWIGALWKSFAKILPITVMKLAPDETYASPRKFMFGYHPHGVLFYGPGVLATNWAEFFPGTICCNLMSSMVFVCPIFRQFCLWIGCIPATAQAARAAVNDYGSSLAVIPGGLAEMMMADSRPRTPTITEDEIAKNGANKIDSQGTMTDEAEGEEKDKFTVTADKRKEVVLFLKNRKGFVRLAMQLGLDLVPVFTHGELELYNQLQWGLPQRLGLSRKFKVPITLVWGHKLFLPFRRPLTVVVGHPIPVEKVENPTPEQVAELHGKYVAALRSMFEETKEECGYGDTHLVIR
eukprot:TRINITY_DN4143_c0_g1_i4.p1 TRINITY_DN4143_c0_g1~~TRINITY_DN4143_c0_g1_i4.p1  ORF type:complete len:384 (-),score=119.36 TRINITY_DN4143_c0_g1_i4:1012-2055(-)